jgi:hypothetical protein
MFMCIVSVLKYNIHSAQSQATLVRVFVFAKQYSIVLALVQALSYHPDQAKSQTPSDASLQIDPSLPHATFSNRSNRQGRG